MKNPIHLYLKDPREVCKLPKDEWCLVSGCDRKARSTHSVGSNDYRVCLTHSNWFSSGKFVLVQKTITQSPDYPPEIWFKSLCEDTTNKHGRDLCAIAGCRKSRLRFPVLGRWVCKSHHNLISTRLVMLVPEPAPLESLEPRLGINDPSWVDGAQVCHAVGCETKTLKFKFRGYFCPLHLRELAKIRKAIYDAKSKGHAHIEVAFRAQERAFRKYQDDTHSLWLNYTGL